MAGAWWRTESQSSAKLRLRNLRVSAAGLSGNSILKADDPLVRFRVAELLADDLVHVGRIRPQPLQDPLLLVQLRLRLREAPLIVRLDPTEAVVLGAGLPEKRRRREAQAHENKEVQANDETAQIHDGDGPSNAVAVPGVKEI